MENYEVSIDKVKKILDLVKKEEETYQAEIGKQLGYSRNVVWRSVKFLNNISRIEKERNGKRVMIKIKDRGDLIE